MTSSVHDRSSIIAYNLQTWTFDLTLRTLATMQWTSREEPLRPSTVKISRSSFIDVAGDSHIVTYDRNIIYNEISTHWHAGNQLTPYYSKICWTLVIAFE